ncbi:MAG TPA: glycogen debranching enzyme N-terminal domain-containing protein, partial [Isosphaeraceae bacterium]|nr:glycogen debranching enzyme N-terminal domain-containing protein [Isosphaeraceae bacterium]
MLSKNPIRRLSRPARMDEGVTRALSREWLVTNGLGGYASGTLPNVPTRRYHGLLVAARPAPEGRVLVLNHLQERFETGDGSSVDFGSLERVGQPQITPFVGDALSEFRLEAGLPVWRFSLGGCTLERRVVLVHGRNVSHVLYQVVEGSTPVRVFLRPFWNIRPHDAPVNTPIDETILDWKVDGLRIEHPGSGSHPAVRLHLSASNTQIDSDPKVERDIFYRIEAERGYAERGDLHSPGSLSFDVLPGRFSALSVSVEPWARFLDTPPEMALNHEIERRQQLLQRASPRARDGLGAELVLAADMFLIKPVAHESANLGDQSRSVIAGYPWFTDWGRDTMISLPGLTVSTGRLQEGRQLLLTFAAALKDGLIPNLFPEGQSEGVYHTADATLWFFHAVDAYVRASGD